VVTTQLGPPCRSLISGPDAAVGYTWRSISVKFKIASSKTHQYSSNSEARGHPPNPTSNLRIASRGPRNAWSFSPGSPLFQYHITVPNSPSRTPHPPKSRRPLLQPYSGRNFADDHPKVNEETIRTLAAQYQKLQSVTVNIQGANRMLPK